MLDVQIWRNLEGAARVRRKDVVELTERATNATFYSDRLAFEQVEANKRIPPLSGQIFFEAATSDTQHLAAAFAGENLAGFMIATRHGPKDLELDWLMVDPCLHGTGIADELMNEGLAWLGYEHSIWLTVLRHNKRAIKFYRRLGFEIDRSAEIIRIIPTWVMRRPPPLPPQVGSKV